MGELVNKTHTRSATVQEVYLHIKLAIIFTSQQENFFDLRKLSLSTHEVDWKTKKWVCVFRKNQQKKVAQYSIKKKSFWCAARLNVRLVEITTGFLSLCHSFWGRKKKKKKHHDNLEGSPCSSHWTGDFFFAGATKIIWFQSSSLCRYVRC